MTRRFTNYEMSAENSYFTNENDALAPKLDPGEQYSVITPKGFRYTVCKPANADGAGLIFPQYVKRDHLKGAVE